MKKERLRPILIERVEPAVDDGRYPCKREVGDRLEVSADIFKAGHDLLDAVILYRARDESRWIQAPMRPAGNDRWTGQIPLERNTRYRRAELSSSCAPTPRIDASRISTGWRAGSRASERRR